MGQDTRQRPLRRGARDIERRIVGAIALVQQESEELP